MEANVVCRDQLIFYKKEGTSQKTVLFLHGWGQNHASLQKFIPAFLGEKFEFVAPDLPGFGKSELPKRPFSVEDYMEVVAAFIEKLKLPTPLFVIGHSFGGRIAIKLAAEKPHLVKKLLLIDSAGIKPQKNLKNVFVRSLAKVGGGIFSLPGISRFKDAAQKKLHEKIGSSDYIHAGPLRETFVKIIEEDLAPFASRISAQTLLVWGENDTDTPLADGQKLQSLIPRAEIAIIKNAGHFCFNDQPAEFQNIMLSFL